MEKPSTILADIDNALIERPRCFTCGRTRFNLYPSTLGVIKVCQPLIQALEIDLEVMRFNPFLELLRVSDAHRGEVSEIIALHTVRGYNEVFNSFIIERRKSAIMNAMNTEQLATLLHYIMMEMQADTSEIEKHLELDKQSKYREQVARVKGDNSGSVTIGGTTLWGGMVGRLCKMYGWTVEYVVWGISFTNIKLLIADEVSDVYLTDKERKRVRVPSRGRLNGDDPEQMARFMEQNKGG